VFDSFYLSFVIVSNTTGMTHLKIKACVRDWKITGLQFHLL